MAVNWEQTQETMVCDVPEFTSQGSLYEMGENAVILQMPARGVSGVAALEGDANHRQFLWLFVPLVLLLLALI